MRRQVIKEWLMKHTAKTLLPIPEGKRGEFSKITEEYLELTDAIKQNNRKLTFIEACDVIDASFTFQFTQFWVPAPLVVVLVYLRRIYKPIRNKIYYSFGLFKEHFNGEIK